MPPKKGHQHLTQEEKTRRKHDRKERKAEKKRQQKRDQLSREVKYGELTYNKYEKNWKEMLTKVALPRMRAELEVAWHNFERVVDCKDFTISLLMDEIQDSEEQYMRSFRAHYENMEKLMNMFQDRLEELKEDFENEVRDMEDRCNVEFQDISETNNDNLNYLKTMLYQLELQRKEHIRLKRGEYISRLDEVDAKDQLVLQKLKASLETKYQNMFTNMQQFIRTYNKQIKERRKEHNELKAADDAIQQLIANQFKQIKRLYDTIRQLKQKYVDLKQTEGGTLFNVQNERTFFSNSFLSLKLKLENDKKEDFHKLAGLSASCALVFDCLEKLNKKGEMILTLAAVCRKLETLEEKMLPYPLCKKTLVAEDDIPLDEDGEIEGVRPEMELFWQRLGQAFGAHYTLSRERKFLTEENALLIDTHNDYCEKLMYPPPLKSKNMDTIPQTDLTVEGRKYRKYQGLPRINLEM